MKYLLIQFLIIFIQSSFGANYEPLLDDVGLETKRLTLSIKVNAKKMLET